jgi:hypothetical protein
MLLNNQKKHLILRKGTIKILAIKSIFAFHAMRKAPKRYDQLNQEEI